MGNTAKPRPASAACIAATGELTRAGPETCTETGRPVLDEAPVGCATGHVGIEDAGQVPQRLARLPASRRRRAARGEAQMTCRMSEILRAISEESASVEMRSATSMPFVDEVDEAVLEPQIDRDHRVLGDEGEDRRRQRRLAQIARRRDPHQPARLGGLVGDRGVEIVELLQQLAGLAVIGLARLGEASLRVVRFISRTPEIVLEVGDILARAAPWSARAAAPRPRSRRRRTPARRPGCGRGPGSCVH